MPTKTTSKPRNAETSTDSDALAIGRPIISAAHEEALRAELARLRQTLEVEFADRLRQARDFGEAGENDEYLQIKEEESVQAARILHVTRLLESAVVMDEVALDPEIATLGSQVEVEYGDSGRRRTLHLVSGHEPIADNVASASSPVGRALMGRRAGETVTVVLPRGDVRMLKVVSVEPGPGLGI